MKRKRAVAWGTGAFLSLALLAACDTAADRDGDVVGPPTSSPSADFSLGSDSCAKYVLVGIWGQSNAARGDRAKETRARGGVIPLAQFDRAVYEAANGWTNVARWDIQAPSGRRSFTWMHREDRQGTIVEPDSNSTMSAPYPVATSTRGGPLTAYIDLANRIYEQTGSCVIFSSEASGGTGLQAGTHPEPHKVWDPNLAGSRFQPALDELTAAYDLFNGNPKFDAENVLLYWNQGNRDASEAAQQFVAFMDSGGPPPTVTMAGWQERFTELAHEARAAFPPGVLKIMLSLSARSKMCPDDPFADSLRTVQTAVANALDFVSLVSEVMPAPSTMEHYVDCIHLSWSQYRLCENRSVASGASALLTGAAPEPLSSCDLPPELPPYGTYGCDPGDDQIALCQRLAEL